MGADKLDEVVLAAKSAERSKREGRKRKVSDKLQPGVNAHRLEEIRLQRLSALEKDNYVEEQDVEDEDYDPLLDDEDDARVKIASARRKSGRKRIELVPLAEREGFKKSGIHRRNAGLHEMDLEERWSANVPSSTSITAAKSVYPSRPFCSVCGFSSNYHCTRCGARFCSLRCEKVHSDTRCLKFLT